MLKLLAYFSGLAIAYYSAKLATRLFLKKDDYYFPQDYHIEMIQCEICNSYIIKDDAIEEIVNNKKIYKCKDGCNTG